MAIRSEDRKNFPRLFWTIVILLIVISSILVLEIIHSKFNREELIRLSGHVLLTLFVAAFVHLVDQLGVWKDIIRMNEKTLSDLRKKDNDLLDSVAKCGIKDVYYSRHDARKQFKEDINKAKERIWLLGVGLNVTLDLQELIPTLRKKKQNKDFDVRILMLDAIRSTAVFRTFLESSPETVVKILDVYSHEDPDPKGKDIYFHQRLHRKFEDTCNSLYDIDELQTSVRFYGHTPLCWMVVVDEVIYFQPYTFGGRPKTPPISVEASSPQDTTQADQETMGDLMPVFKFQGDTDLRPFKVLEDHFKKLWSTSDIDLFHIQARQKAREHLVQEIFKTRDPWLKQVKGVLNNQRKKDEKPLNQKPDDKNARNHMRQTCPDEFKVKLYRLGLNSALPLSARILDFSSNGMALSIKADGLSANQVVRLENETKELSEVAKFYNDTLLRKDNRYIIKRIDRDKECIGLQKLETTDRNNHEG